MKDNRSEETVRTKRPYIKPAAKKLTREEARLKLPGEISDGNEEVKELAEKMFPEVRPKKSA